MQPLFRFLSFPWILVLATNSVSAEGDFVFPPPLRERVRLSPIEDFTPYGGVWTAENGELLVTGGPGPKLVHGGPAFTTGEVSVEVALADRRSGNAGLIVKVGEPGVGADSFIGYEIALDAERRVLRLGRHRHDFSLIRDVRSRLKR